MDEIIVLMVLLFVAYLFLSKKNFFLGSKLDKSYAADGVGNILIPEDSVLRRHYITQLRSEIELELSPRPTDFSLQRHYDAMVSAKLEKRLASLEA